jgi:hypothetical protein
MDSWGKRVSGNSNSTCKDPEAGVCLRSSEKATERPGWREQGHKSRQSGHSGNRDQIAWALQVV